MKQFNLCKDKAIVGLCVNFYCHIHPRPHWYNSDCKRLWRVVGNLNNYTTTKENTLTRSPTPRVVILCRGKFCAWSGRIRFTHKIYLYRGSQWTVFQTKSMQLGVYSDILSLLLFQAPQHLPFFLPTWYQGWSAGFFGKISGGAPPV